MINKKLLGKPIIFPVIVVLAVIIAVINIKSRSTVQHEDQSMQPRLVEVIYANTVPTRVTSVGYGTVEPAIALVSRAEVSGKISYIHPQLRQGGSLSKDTVVLRIDAVDYELSLSEREAGLRSSQSLLEQLQVEEKSTRRSLKLAKKNLKVGEVELKRKHEIRAKQLISKTEVDAEEQKVLGLRQSVEDLQGKLNAFASRKAATQAQIEQTATQVEGQQETLGRTEIRLPFDARIGNVSVEKGEFVNVGAELFEALNNDGVEITAQLPIRHMRPLVATLKQPTEATAPSQPVDITQLLKKLNLQARVRLVGDDFEGAVWDARVIRMSESVDPTRRTAGVVVAIDNPYQKVIPGIRPPLLKGMYVAVELMALASPMRIIPRHVVHQGKVYVAGKDNTLQLRPVKISLTQNELVAIASGLEEGEQVIVTDLIPVIVGMPLQPVHHAAAQEALTQQAAAE